MRLGRNIAITLICIILGTMIAWQYKSINYNQGISAFQNKRAEELIDDLIVLQNQNNDLRKRNEELQKEVSQYENAKAGDSLATQNLLNELQTARIFGGLVDVKGKGVIITIDNGEEFDVVDMDILGVLNELRACDVQAISVNKERVVAMTEIRSAPPYIMINGRQMVAPFVIEAIGDPERIQHSLMIINGIIEKLEELNLKVSIKQSENITIPKVRDDGTVIKIDYLNPVN